MMLSFNDDKQKKRIEELYKKEEEDLAQILSKKYGIPYTDLTVQPIDTNGLRLIPEDEARETRTAIFDLVGRKIKIAVLSPSRDKTQAIIKMLEGHGYLVEQYLVSTQSLERAWSRYKDISYATESKAGSLDIANKEIEDLTKDVRSVDGVRKMIIDVIKMKRSFKISRIVEVVAAGAIAVGASDIHIEPEEFDTRIRFRMDGILVDITRLDMDTFKLLLSRIKLLSGMKLNIKNISQDGRFTIHLTDSEIEIRSSVLPGAYNETVVMRLLDPKSIGVPLEELGIREDLLEIFLKEIDKPNGMILNTGPTGSGKTTTLYAFLKKKKNSEVKVITIEDPIEYHLPGIVQTQVDNKKGYTFASGLKSSLRQDPDVIMVGEIRDLETAETAVHAALTGHLVFSTLHTNNAAGAFTRLIDLGINPKILTSAINLAIAQRLVRRLCQSCKKEVILSPEKISILKEVYNSIENPPIPWNEIFYEPQGCVDCNELGYKGRIGIYEAVLSDKAIEEILQRNPSEREIKNTAKSQGIMDMAQDGVIKIIQGITTITEVERVVNLKTREANLEKSNGDEIEIADVSVNNPPIPIINPSKENKKEVLQEKSESKKDNTEITSKSKKVANDTYSKESKEPTDEQIPLTPQTMREEIVLTSALGSTPNVQKKNKEKNSDESLDTSPFNTIKINIEKNKIPSSKKPYNPRPDIVVKKTSSQVTKPNPLNDSSKKEEKIIQEKIKADQINKSHKLKEIENERINNIEKRKKEENDHKFDFIEDDLDNLAQKPSIIKENKKISHTKDDSDDIHFLEKEPDTLSSQSPNISVSKNAKPENKKELNKFILDDDEEYDQKKKSWDIFNEDDEDSLGF